MWQFGQVEMIPLRSHTDQYGNNFGLETLEVEAILQRWESVMTIDVQALQP